MDDQLQKTVNVFKATTEAKNNFKKSVQLDKKAITRSEKVEVFIRVVFLKIGDIKTVEEKFDADVFLQARWREPLLDIKGNEDFDPDTDFEILDHSKYWNPKLTIDNKTPGTKSSTWYMVRLDSKGRATLIERRRINGTFLESMELNQFPFDKQDLTVTVTTERGDHEIILAEDKKEVSAINVSAFGDAQEWSLHEHIESSTKVTTNAFRNQKHKHPAISLCCKASRRPDYFIWNFAAIQMLICSLVFTTFAVDLNLVPNRLQLSFILLLSNITFKFVVTNSLPKVSYLTVLDKYVLSQMTTLILVCVWHAIIFEFRKRKFAKTADSIACGIFGILYILIQIGFVLYWRITTYLREKEYGEKDEEQSQLEKQMTMGDMQNS